MMRDQAKVLIVNADDFGITEGATDAIIDCHRAGSVTSTTLMTNMPAAAYAAQCAREHPALGVGLHFNLTSGRPLGAAVGSSMVDRHGALLNRRDLALRAISGRLRAGDVRAELKAQHAAMRTLGLAPTHLDSHQHVHAIPGIFQVVAAFAAEHGLPMRMPWGWAGHAPGKRMARIVKERVMGTTLKLLDRDRPKSVLVNDGLCSVFDLGVPPEQLTLEHYRTLLAPYRVGVIELMVHPAYVDAALMSETAITGTSDAEQRLLMDPGFTSMAAALGYRLATFRDLAQGRH